MQIVKESHSPYFDQGHVLGLDTQCGGLDIKPKAVIFKVQTAKESHSSYFDQEHA
eukprot:c15294_g1_i1 orf=123-287(+)